MPKLLILSKQAGEYERLVAEAALPELEILACSNPQEAPAIGRECEIVYGDARLIREIIGQLPNLRWVQSTSAGVESLLDPVLRRDYILTNAHGVFGASMSEYVFAYLLAHERRVFERDQAQKERRWDRRPGGRLRGKTIGILGVGSIGAEIARFAKHFGLTVRGFTRSSESCPDVDAYFHGDQLLPFAQGLDYLVCVLPNTRETRHILGAALLAALPAHAILINVGRGAAVDESALVEALNTGRLALAVLDVFQQEPLPEDHPFWDTPNLHLTFHTSALSEPADLVRPFIENYRRYLRGETLEHQVDFERGY